MKTTAWLSIVLLMSGAFFLQSSGLITNNTKNSLAPDPWKYPSEVKNVIDQKCYGCHSVKGQSQDAKDALMWDDLPGLTKGKLIAKLDHIVEVLEEGSMPPEEAVKKYPQLKLSEEDVRILKGWASAKADSLLN